MTTGSNAEPAANLSDIRRKLIWRMAVAGIMIAGLLGGLAFFDYLGSRIDNEPEATRYTEPVPVPKKNVTQPVTPVAPIPEVKEEKKEPAAPEVTSAPVDRSAPKLDVPSRPPVGAQTPSAKAPQALSRSAGATAPTAPTVPAKAADSRTMPAETPPVRHDAPAPAASPAPQPSLSRMLSGFALQAGVFSDPRRAEELHARLTLEGIPSTIEARVQVGPFKSKEEAEAARAKMKTMGIDAVMLLPGKAKR